MLNRKKVFKLAKGFRNRSKNCKSISYRKIIKSLQYSYIDRNNKKRILGLLWLQRIKGGLKYFSLNYSLLKFKFRIHDMDLNRKILSELMITEPITLKSLIYILNQ